MLGFVLAACGADSVGDPADDPADDAVGDGAAGDHGTHRSGTAPELIESDLASTWPLHRFGDDLYLAGIPSEADFRAFADAGIRTICDLCDTGERGVVDPEPDLVRSLGMVYLHRPMAGDERYGDAVFDEGRRILREAERPLVMHCQSSNRVGAVFLTWCVLDLGMEPESALVVAKNAGLSSSELERRATTYIESRRAR